MILHSKLVKLCDKIPNEWRHDDDTASDISNPSWAPDELNCVLPEEAPKKSRRE